MSTTQQAEDLDLATLNPLFERQSPVDIMKWSAAQFGSDLVMTSSFGAESALLIHMAIQEVPDLRIIFVNTGYLFPETHAFMEQLGGRFNLNVGTSRTPNDPTAWLGPAGEETPSGRKDVAACCAANKNEPMERAMAELQPKAW